MLKTILEELSIDRVMADSRYFAEETPMRLAGSEMEKKAAAHIKAQFDAAGIPIELHEIDGYVSFPHSARVEVISPVQRTIEARAFAQAKATPPEGLEAEMVFVGAGGLADYDGLDVKGRITLSELSYSPPRPEKVRIATVNGSVGQVMMNWGLPEHNTVPMGTCKAVWGNPTLDNFERMPSIPAIGISRADGNWLVDLAKQGPVRIRIFCDVDSHWGKIIQPIATLRGSVEPEKFVLVAGHYDAWGPGSTDNATGNAQMLEIARVLAKHQGELRRSVVFAFWAAHESGIMEGSTWYVDKHWDTLSKNCVCSLNIDSAGMIGATEYKTDCSPEVSVFHKRLAEEVLGLKDHETRPLTRTGDQSFFGIGVPSIYSAHEHPEEQQKLWRGATLGWWYHSEFDTMDKVDPAILHDGLRMSAAYVYELATLPVVPFDFAAVSKVIVGRLTDIASHDVGIDLHSLVTAAEDLVGSVGALSARGAALRQSNDAESIARYNAILLKLSRILTPITGSVAGKWTQDTYGLTALRTALPGLANIARMAEAGKDSDYYKLAWTDAVRQRNRAADGLADALTLLDDYLAEDRLAAAQ